jgi:hypothetical protein
MGLSKVLRLCSESEQEVSGDLEAEPTAGHAGRDLKQVWYNALVHALYTFLTNDDSNCIKYRFVLVTHPGHGVDLETATENIARFCQHISWWKTYTYKGYVHVCATAPEMAPAASFRTALGFLSPSGVRYFRTSS